MTELLSPITHAELTDADICRVSRARRGPVTSVEWCPFESSMLCTASSDGQVAAWDLALERDPEEEAALAAHMNAASPDDVPPQLLFVHLGQVGLLPDQAA